ncbi:MAG: tannase/feruloyl esterase family alpha/beta hydrolase [Acidobacteriota bacterium]|nr:tannase/feruloyl esterase family alpha/beta hydrolase [Acidobacteriota bacterium]
MQTVLYSIILLFTSSVLLLIGCGGPIEHQLTSQEEADCLALTRINNLTITSAELMEATDSMPQYCYVKGLIAPAIFYHVQLPLPNNWNGRFLQWGDGGKDGDLDFADHRVTEGYAVANSNTGHDSGSEPSASFGFNNRQAEIDYGYRSVHLTVNAAKTVVKNYYAQEPAYSYLEGCSTGGNQGLTEAQRYPYDFDGIIAGAPVLHYQATNISHAFMLKKVFQNNFEANLAFDTDGNGLPDSLTKLKMLEQAVLEKCDGNDGIIDKVIDNPLNCNFDPSTDLANMMCNNDVDADNCFTKAQLQTIKDIYRGPYDSKEISILKGKSFGSEWAWPASNIPHEGNSLFPINLGYIQNHFNFIFYEEDPGIPPPDVTDLSYVPDKNSTPPEYAWWEFDMDDVTAGKGRLMMSIFDAVDPNLTRYLLKNGGKLMLYHGWSDFSPAPEPTLDYYTKMVDTVFEGDFEAAREHSRIFMLPGMGHCRGGPGPNSWDKLPALVDWVENGNTPDYLVVTHSTDGVIDNERKVCAYPEQTVYNGPDGGENDPVNWVEENFICQPM